jgi:hypothetical protein
VVETHRATLTIHLVDDIAAADLASLISGLDKLYTLDAVLEHIIAAPQSDQPPDVEARTPRFELLWIARLEIGTPNVLTLRGVPRRLSMVAALLGTLLGAPVTMTQGYKNWAEAQLAREQTKLTRLEVDEKLEALKQRQGFAPQYQRLTSDLETSKQLLGRGTQIVSPRRPLEIDLDVAQPTRGGASVTPQTSVSGESPTPKVQ